MTDEPDFSGINQMAEEHTRRPINEAVERIERLIGHLETHGAQMVARSYATDLRTILAAIERWHSAYVIAHNQAMENGQSLAEARAALRTLGG
jgi:hypothetical protein